MIHTLRLKRLCSHESNAYDEHTKIAIRWSKENKPFLSDSVLLHFRWALMVKKIVTENVTLLSLPYQV